jgi:amidase
VFTVPKGESKPALCAPTLDEVRDLAASLNLVISESDLEQYRGLLAGNLSRYETVDAMVETKPVVKHPRDPGHRPTPEEDPYNAWYWKTEIKGAEDGLLAGKRVSVKDTISVAGVPMAAGARPMAGFVPDIDATVVTRILDAGGIIAGKAQSEGFSVGGAGHNSFNGPVRNPHNPTRSSGGSSSGSGALVAARQVDMSIGGDQGGSVRLPASWCGVYGLKPTRGVMPYTGVMQVDQTLDHVGPMANSAREVALLLEATAGPDGLDPRQEQFAPEPYSQMLTGKVDGLRIGILKEGFGYEGVSEPDVDRSVMNAAEHFRKLGAEVVNVSIPAHRDGQSILVPIAFEGAYATLILGNGLGYGWPGFYDTHLQEYFLGCLPRRADELSQSAKMFLLMGAYVHGKYRGRYYAKAQNLARQLASAYQDAFQKVDLLLMPATPKKANELPPENCGPAESVGRSFEMFVGTGGQFNLTGLPAMTVPCAMSEGLPVGMMLIGRLYEDRVVLNAAHSFEGTTDWRTRQP